MTQLSFDHAVILVPDLKNAVSQFSKLGFVVTLSGEHEHTCNALIIFNDQTYIELLALKKSWSRPLLRAVAKIGVIDHIARRKSDVSWRLMRWIGCSYGALDWCIRVDDMQTARACYQANDLPLLEDINYQRLRPDGKVARWLLGSAKDLDLPFLIKDQTPIDIRIPLGKNTEHPNGASGFKRIHVTVKDATNVANCLNAFFDSQTMEKDSMTSVSKLKAQIVCSDKTPAKLGKFSLELEYSGKATKLLDVQRTYGTQIWLTS
ncbi:VOC family protein [uncultured Paraglaciecola sp.]|uniref:VOC family protein n=1 Tax=uncultured Paraglaciecola sp. TaxID=1765024 RepID=UPI0025FA122F|nr:VOC family protein [uncultured Paraglaciecola sp.]